MGIFFVVKLGTNNEEFEVLGNAKAEEINRTALLLGIIEAHQQAFIQLTTPPGMTYGRIKRTVAESPTYGVRLQSVSFAWNGTIGGGNVNHTSTVSLRLSDRRTSVQHESSHLFYKMAGITGGRIDRWRSWPRMR